MRKLLFWTVGISVCLVATWAQVPIREIDVGHGTGGGTSAQPVDVMNFPLDDATGGLIAFAPVANRVLDLLDDEVALSSAAEYWDSEVFSTGVFNRIAVQTTVSQPGPSTTCEVQWALTADETWLGTSGQSNSPLLSQLRP